MTPRRRIAIGVAAALVAVVAGIALVVAVFGGDDGGGSDVRADSSSTTTSSVPPAPVVEESTTTTFDLVPQDTTTTTARPAPTTTAAPAPVVTGTGAVLKAPASSATRKMTGDDCETLADAGWSAECGTAVVKGGTTLVWLIESKPVTVGSSATARRGFVLGPAPAGSGSDNWRVLLEARDDNGTRWKSVAVRAVDASGDGGAEIVWGFRAASGGSLAVDMVEGPGTVTAHVDLRQGSARVSTGQLDTWALVSGSASGSTARYQHDLIRWQDNAWRVVSRTQVPAGEVPPSHF